MNDARFAMDHVHIEANKPFEEVAKAFEQQLGRFDWDVYKFLAEGGDTEKARARIEEMEGPSGFMLFRRSDHGALLRIVGLKRKVVQYLIGHPLFALQVTLHDIRASLYSPLRVLLYEDEQARTCLEYDTPSSIFGQFGHAEITAVAVTLDQKLEALMAAAIE